MADLPDAEQVAEFNAVLTELGFSTALERMAIRKAFRTIVKPPAMALRGSKLLDSGSGGEDVLDDSSVLSEGAGGRAATRCESPISTIASTCDAETIEQLLGPPLRQQSAADSECSPSGRLPGARRHSAIPMPSGEDPWGLSQGAFRRGTSVADECSPTSGRLPIPSARHSAPSPSGEDPWGLSGTFRDAVAREADECSPTSGRLPSARRQSAAPVPSGGEDARERALGWEVVDPRLRQVASLQRLQLASCVDAAALWVPCAAERMPA